VNDWQRSAAVSCLLVVTLNAGCRGILGVEDGTLREGAGGGAGTATNAGSGGTQPSSGGSAGGEAVSYRSCLGLPRTCGPAGDADCCSSSLVPGGSFLRSYDGETYDDDGYPAAVHPFVLDKNEVTVGRFRKFVDAYPASKPAPGSGKNPNNAEDPGWDSAWTATSGGQFSFDHLPANKDDLLLVLDGLGTWTESRGENESLPITYINWYVAFAFCIWDGGRLPTEAEWNYAAAGGDEQRVYPWGSEPPDDTRAVYCEDGTDAGDLGPCFAPSPQPQPVGSKSPKGDGAWELADLAGNVEEWTLDTYVDPYTQVTCIDCSNMAVSSFWVVRGGSYDDHANALLSSYRKADNHYSAERGVRCARSADQER